MASSLTVANVEAGYGAVRILHDVSLQVGAGETVALLGTNGNGKSTLMKSIMGIVRPSAGSIRAVIDGAEHELVGRSTEEIVDLGIGFVPEGRRLFPKLTVTENLLLGAFRPTARSAIGRNLDFCFETFPASEGACAPARRQHERRRAADAGAGAGADVGAAHPADRRAVGRPGAAAGQPHHRQDQGAEGGLSTSSC